jgi:hypothetical protein
MSNVVSMPDLVIEERMPTAVGDKPSPRVLLLTARAHASIKELVPPWARLGVPRRRLYLSDRDTLYALKRARKRGFEVRWRRIGSTVKPPSYAYLHAPAQCPTGV